MKRAISFSRLLSRRAELDEAAFVLPVLLLVSLALINLALFGFAAMSAANAANYGARMGSVAQADPVGVAQASANGRLADVSVGSYAVSVSGSGQPGSLMTVSVTYQVPNYFNMLTQFFGVQSPTSFIGESQAYFRKEGW